MKRLCYFFSVIMLTVFTGCSSLAVKTDFDREANFTKYISFAFIAPPFQIDWPPSKSLTIKLALRDLQHSIEHELLLKGMRRVEIINADFVIAYHVGVEKNIDISAYGYEYKKNWQVLNVHRYNISTLVIDFVDKRARKLFWRGWADGVIGNRIESTDKLGRAVEKIINNYPPG